MNRYKILTWLGVIFLIIDIQISAVEPLVYLPFDGDWLNYGQAGYGEEGTVVTHGGSTPVFGTGIKGQCADITSGSIQSVPDIGFSPVSGYIYYGVPTDLNDPNLDPNDPNTYVDTEIETGLNGLASFSIAYWVYGTSDLIYGTAPLWRAHICDRHPGGELEIFHSDDGSARQRVNYSWISVPHIENEDMPSGEWVFYVSVYDSTNEFGPYGRIFMGRQVEGTYELTELSCAVNYNYTNVGTVYSSHEPLLIGVRNLDGSWGIDAMIDEFRIFGSKTDDSGALTFKQAESLMNYDLGASEECGDVFHGYPVGDFDENCITDMNDLGSFMESWLDDINP